MTNPLSFDDLQAILHQGIAHLPDHRKHSPHTRYTIVLKTKGYHVEHNFGHGKQYLSAVMLSLNLLALLCRTVLEWSDDTYALLCRVLARRQTFFDDIRALTRYRGFDSWDHLMDFMIQGLALQPESDTS